MGASKHGIAGKALLRQLKSGEALSADRELLLLPSPPVHLEFDQFGFDNRTSNALDRAGFRDCPAGLGDITVGEVLRIRGFGLRCLETYLEASLSWEQKDRRPEFGRSITDRIESMVKNAEAGRLAVLAPCTLPPLPGGTTLNDLDLSVRTRNCLDRLGIRTSRKLRDCTIGDLMESRGFGHLSLINLLEAIARVHAGKVAKPKTSQRRTRIEVSPDAAIELADRLESILLCCEVKDNDRRFGERLKGLRCNNSTELIEGLRHVRMRSHRHLEAAGRFVQHIENATQVSLEEEAAAIRGIEPASRSEGMLRAYFGFGERIAVTLKEVADEYGLTKERVRQICSPTWIRKEQPYQPVLKRVLTYIDEEAPRRCVDVEAALMSRAEVEADTQVGEILRYAAANGLEPDLTELIVEDERIVISRRAERDVQDARSRAKRLIERHGATTGKRVYDDALRGERDPPSAPFIQQILELDPQFTGVLRDPMWFILSNSAGRSLSQRVQAVLAVARSLTVREVRNALRREYRDGLWIPPTAVLARILPTVRHVRCTDDIVELGCDLDYRDLVRSSDVIVIVEILRGESGLCERRKLQSLAQSHDVSESNFWRIVNYSPLIARPGRGIYSLVGTVPPPGVIEEMQASSRLMRGGGLDRGWTADGRLWLAYRLSASTLETGVVGIPTAVRPSLSNEYIVVSGDVATGSGPIRIGETSAWGFRSAVADAGAEAGDCMILIFDLSARTCEISVGDETMVVQWLSEEPLSVPDGSDR